MANPTIALTFSEAALAEKASSSGKACNGLDAGNPLCGRVVLRGKAVPLTDTKTAQQIFATRHPLAPWLATGGAHTGGTYFTIELETVSILDFFGGSRPVDVQEYLSWDSTATSKSIPVGKATSRMDGSVEPTHMLRGMKAKASIQTLTAW